MVCESYLNKPVIKIVNMYLMLPFPSEVLMLGSVHKDRDYIFQVPCMRIREGTCSQRKNMSRNDVCHS